MILEGDVGVSLVFRRLAAEGAGGSAAGLGRGDIVGCQSNPNCPIAALVDRHRRQDWGRDAVITLCFDRKLADLLRIGRP